MTIKKIILSFSLCTVAAIAFGQFPEDSAKAEKLIAGKLQSLRNIGVTRYLHLFSDAGILAILYEKNGKIKAVKSFYRGKKEPKLQSARLTKKDKLNFSACIGLVTKDTIVKFSDCRENVHAFHRIVFRASGDAHSISGSFTSDCREPMKQKNLFCFYEIWENLR